MKCPGCATALTVISYEGVEIHSCDGCGGEFLGADEIGHIVRTREATWTAADAGATPVHGVPVSAQTRSLACPRCDAIMRVINYGGDTGVFVDRCDTCDGLWLDHDELERVQTLCELWADQAPARIRQVAATLDEAQAAAVAATRANFPGSRFGFVNAVLSRLLDVAA